MSEAYPASGIIKKCHKAGVNMTLGSDAHQPDDVGRHFDRAFSLLRSAGYTHLATFTERRRIDVPIKINELKTEIK